MTSRFIKAAEKSDCLHPFVLISDKAGYFTPQPFSTVSIGLFHQSRDASCPPWEHFVPNLTLMVYISVSMILVLYSMEMCFCDSNQDLF